MIKEAIEKILSLATPNFHEQDDLVYCDKPLTLIQLPMPTAVEVSTLQGLVDLYSDADIDDINSELVFVHVVNPALVELLSKDVDDSRRRRCWARAAYGKGVQPFPFGMWLDPETFIIQAQIGFQRALIEKDDGSMAKDLDYVLKIAGNIVAGKERSNTDDGITQTVNVRAGVSLKTEETLRGIVNLAAYRTFSEVDQPVSRFLFRARGDERGSQLALFEADGGRWRLAATEAISEWLDGKFGDTTNIVA